MLPNEAHLLAAVHLAHGGLHVTLNLDEGIELACDLLTGTRPLPPGAAAELLAALPAWRTLVPAASFPAAGVVTVASEDEFRAWDRSGRPPALLKLHGSLRTTPAGVRLVDPVVVDELELAQLSPPRRAALAALAQHHRVLVTGYAGEDIDVYTPLLDTLAATATRFTWSTGVALVARRPASSATSHATQTSCRAARRPINVSASRGDPQAAVIKVEVSAWLVGRLVGDAAQRSGGPTTSETMCSREGDRQER